MFLKLFYDTKIIKFIPIFIPIYKLCNAKTTYSITCLMAIPYLGIEQTLRSGLLYPFNYAGLWFLSLGLFIRAKRVSSFWAPFQNLWFCKTVKSLYPFNYAGLYLPNYITIPFSFLQYAEQNLFDFIEIFTNLLFVHDFVLDRPPQ